MGLPTTSRGANKLLRHLAGLKSALITGGSAGNHTVSGIAVVDSLVAVIALEKPARIKQTVVNGAAAGNVTVTGITTSDELLSVVRLDVEADTGTSASGNKIQSASDLTAEFTITAADTINNTGGTNTTSDLLLVTYLDASTGAAGADLTSEFTISAANTINNTSGTVTTGQRLLVLYHDDSAVS